MNYYKSELWLCQVVFLDMLILHSKCKCTQANEHHTKKAMSRLYIYTLNVKSKRQGKTTLSQKYFKNNLPKTLGIARE